MGTAIYYWSFSRLAHKRIEIKAALAQAMALDPALAKTTVMTDRVNEVWEKDTPIVHISIPDEKAEKFAEAPRILKRQAMTAIEIVVAGAANAERVERLAALIEDRINRDLTLGRLVTDTVLVNSSFETNADGKQPLSSQLLIYQITYHTEETPPLATIPARSPVIQFRR